MKHVGPGLAPSEAEGWTGQARSWGGPFISEARHGDTGRQVPSAGLAGLLAHFGWLNSKYLSDHLVLSLAAVSARAPVGTGLGYGGHRCRRSKLGSFLYPWDGTTGGVYPLEKNGSEGFQLTICEFYVRSWRRMMREGAFAPRSGKTVAEHPGPRQYRV